MKSITLGQWIRSGVVLLATLIIYQASPTLSAAVAPPLTDRDINNAVETVLFVDNYVPASQIDVATAEGIVTLSGTVDNLLAKERAVQLAESINGVRAVIDRVSVAPTIRPDPAIKSDVEQAILDDPAVGRYDIHVTVINGVVALTGKVGSYVEQQLAPTVVKAVRGVTAVNNDITFSMANALPRTDDEIAADVQRRLDLDIWVYDRLIKVAVTNGAVHLTGQVRSANGKRRATADAWVTGVQTVDNTGLQVISWLGLRRQRDYTGVNKSDVTLAQDIRTAFLYDPRLTATNVAVAVQYGIATLRGVVDNLAAKRAAEADAYDTVGVWNVANLIKVRPVTMPSDVELTKRIDAAFRRDPYLEISPVKVTVRHGIVTLSGAVDSIAERSQAAAVANRIRGVLEVRNFVIALPATARELLNPPDLKYNLPPPTLALPLATRDQQLQKALEYQLLWNSFLDAAEVHVAVVDGVVTLTGTVDSWVESGAAEDSALKAGARNVINHLKVRR